MTTGSPIEEIRGEHERAEEHDRARQGELLLTPSIKDFILERGWILSEDKMLKMTTDYQAFLTKARPIIEKQEREKITPDVEEVIRVLGKVVPHDQNDMIKWAVKSQDSVYTNAGVAYRLLLALKQTLEKEE